MQTTDAQRSSQQDVTEFNALILEAIEVAFDASSAPDEAANGGGASAAAQPTYLANPYRFSR